MYDQGTIKRIPMLNPGVWDPIPCLGVAGNIDHSADYDSVCDMGIPEGMSVHFK